MDMLDCIVKDLHQSHAVQGATAGAEYGISQQVMVTIFRKLSLLEIGTILKSN